ncbi:MAG: BamA/TamA family outer membrane protein [Alphaproteobacteria bacterium]|nr:BamA/TamA family outer membrane protein [Alphaproteobacteria bacterium]
MRRFFILPLVLAAVPLLAGCKHKDTPFLPEPSTHYVLEGLGEDKETQSYLQSVMDSRLATPLDVTDQAQMDSAVSARARGLQTDLLRAMKARGYYGAKVSFTPTDNSTQGTYSVTPGPLYTIKSIAVTPKGFSALGEKLPLHAGDPLRAKDVLLAEAELVKMIEKDRCAFSLQVTHTALLQAGKTEAALTFSVEAGPESVFGPVSFDGLDSVHQAYLRKLVPWKEGDCFKRSKLDAFRQTLLSGGLFSVANITAQAPAAGSNSAPITVSVKESALRTVRAGLSYYTDAGPGAIFGWTHRNFFGNAEELDVSLNLSSLEQSLDATLDKPFFLRKDQSLSFNASLSRENTDAYDSFGVKSGFRIKRKFTKFLSGAAGTDLNLTHISEDSGGNDTFGLISVPVSVMFDNRDDTLDPHKGAEARASFEPFFDAFGASSPFFKTIVSGSTYYAAGRRTVFAVRGKVGSIGGTTSADIPASERFYAGGGGSVRGFGYQDIGPFEDGNPLGGRSLVEMSGEVRFKMSKTIGAVAFVDAGNVSETIAPSVSDLSVGAGLGLRYYTGFGPVRFDVATPLSGDEHAQRQVQVYISIGQAF